MITLLCRRATVALIGLAVLITGCSIGSPSNSAGHAASVPAPSLATAVTTAGGTWAVAVAGGSAANHDDFWQLLARPAISPTWRLVTPPGVASNGGLVIAPAGPQALTAAFRPSQSLAFTPLATTASLGRHWSAGVLDAALASTPAALAADSATGRMLALLASGTVEQSGNHGVTWTKLTSYREIKATRPGRACRLQNLTAVAFTPAGQPLVAGTCARAGTSPIFTFTGNAWQAAGPSRPPSAASQPITVLTMATLGVGRTVAVLQAGTGSSRTLTAAWSAAGGVTASGWLLSPPHPLRGAAVLSASAGSDETVAVVLSSRAGLVETRPAGAWQALPQLPARTQTLAIGPGSAIQAIAPAGRTITIWTASQPAGQWTRLQHMAVPIQYGTSG